MAAAIGRLKQRSEFLRVAGARRKWAAPGLVLQGFERPDGADAPGPPRVGFTATRKIGGAVQRNRARRRLRAAAAAVMPDHASAGWDYVIVAREGTLTRPFAGLLDDLSQALVRVSRGGQPGRPSPRAASPGGQKEGEGP
ncbi:MAG: ribonuclease P protein component [Alphaproteobacteria bacterium]